jgi:molecular chaperone Hsp33
MGLSGTVRALAVRSTGVARQLVEIHGALPTAGAVLARVATAGLLLGGTIKGREQVGIELRADGPLGGLYAVADARGAVRATIDNPYIDLPAREDGRFDIATALGKGQLIVTKSLGLKDSYRGVVPLEASTIAEDLCHYFYVSEQKPAAMALSELIDGEAGVRAAGGYLVQAFPGADEADLAGIERAISRIPPLSQLLADGVGPEDVLRLLIPDLTVLESYAVQHKCTCSAERFEHILVSLGAEELRSLADEQVTTELRCHFCNQVYHFSRRAVRELARRAAAAD